MAELQSDFLLLPPYFFADDNLKSLDALKEKFRYAHDWLLKLSKVYKGVVIGGTLLRNEDGSKNTYVSTPILKNTQVIDWYNKRHLDDHEKNNAKEG